MIQVFLLEDLSFYKGIGVAGSCISLQGDSVPTQPSSMRSQGLLGKKSTYPPLDACTSLFLIPADQSSRKPTHSPQSFSDMSSRKPTHPLTHSSLAPPENPLTCPRLSLIMSSRKSTHPLTHSSLSPSENPLHSPHSSDYVLKETHSPQSFYILASIDTAHWHHTWTPETHSPQSFSRSVHREAHCYWVQSSAFCTGGCWWRQCPGSSWTASHGAGSSGECTPHPSSPSPPSLNHMTITWDSHIIVRQWDLHFYSSCGLNIHDYFPLTFFLIELDKILNEGFDSLDSLGEQVGHGIHEALLGIHLHWQVPNILKKLWQKTWRSLIKVRFNYRYLFYFCKLI